MMNDDRYIYLAFAREADGTWQRGPDETDAEYVERCAHLDGLFPAPDRDRQAWVGEQVALLRSLKPDGIDWRGIADFLQRHVPR